MFAKPPNHIEMIKQLKQWVLKKMKSSGYDCTFHYIILEYQLAGPCTRVTCYSDYCYFVEPPLVEGGWRAPLIRSAVDWRSEITPSLGVVWW